MDQIDAAWVCWTDTRITNSKTHRHAETLIERKTIALHDLVPDDCNRLSALVRLSCVYASIRSLEGNVTDKSELPMALRAAYVAMHRRSEACFAKYGVTADQFVLLATLARGNAMTQRELARRMPSDPSTVRAMLVLLEKQGLVRRDSHPNDSRARTAALTAAGKRMYQQVFKAGESIRRQMFESFQPGEGELLTRLLNQVAESLKSESASVSRSV